VVGLRSSDHDPVPPSVQDSEPFGPPYLVDLGFETQESLNDVAQRLRESGFAAKLVTDDAAHVAVTDPDGHEIQIHRAP
jgi:hypothetical protein